MKRHTTMVALMGGVALTAALVAASGRAAAFMGQDLSAQKRAELCKEKKDGLARLEKEASELRTGIPKMEKSLKNLLSLSPAELDERLDYAVNQVERLKNRKGDEGSLAFYRAIMDLFTELKMRQITSGVELQESPFLRRANDKLKALKQRQTEVGRQIFLLRESIESLKCSNLEGHGFLGTWLFRGYKGATCTVGLVAGNRLRLVTERGDVGHGYFESPTTIVVDFPFARGLKGYLSEDGNRINWSNREFWVRVSH